MPAPRISATGLGKLLNSAKQPIYVLDKDLTIVFLNQACREWLGEAAEALLGRRCAYHSSPAAGPDALAAGLCPPPAVLSGETSTAPVCCCGRETESPPNVWLASIHSVGVPAVCWQSLPLWNRLPADTSPSCKRGHGTDSLACASG